MNELDKILKENGISNNLPEMMEKYRQDELKRIDFTIKWGKRITLSAMFLLMALLIYHFFINPSN